jgi:hypothetical protein
MGNMTTTTCRTCPAIIAAPVAPVTTVCVWCPTCQAARLAASGERMAAAPPAPRVRLDRKGQPLSPGARRSSVNWCR